MSSPILSYLFFALAVLTIVARTLGFIDDAVMLTLLGMFGFSGIAALRSFIEAKGWKTYTVVGFGFLGVVGVAFGVLTPEQAAYWFSVWGIISGSTLAHAVQKEKNIYFR